MTMRCSRCDIAHEETSRCPTDLEYERGYRAGLDQAKITIAEREKHLSAAECSNVSLRQRLAAAEAAAVTARNERDEYKRLYELRGKALMHPCLQCGYQPKVISLTAKGGRDET